MRRRLPAVAFILYVALDLSNPLMPGAFNFNPDTSVDAAQASVTHRTRTTPARSAVPEHDRPSTGAGRSSVGRPPVHRVVSDWLPAARSTPPAAAPAPPATDDH